MARGPWWPEGSARDVLELHLRTDLQAVHVGGDDALLVALDQELELAEHRVVGDRGVRPDRVGPLGVLALEQDAGADRQVQALALGQPELLQLRCQPGHCTSHQAYSERRRTKIFESWL